MPGIGHGSISCRSVLRQLRSQPCQCASAVNSAGADGGDVDRNREEDHEAKELATTMGSFNRRLVFRRQKNVPLELDTEAE
nr:hypothetical protein CFP56_76321 [Quercus suber]